jgi:cobalt/nickel transport protein
MINSGGVRRLASAAVMAVMAAVWSAGAEAHFQEVIPSRDIITSGDDAALDLEITFTHPFEGGPVMDMAPPVRFAVLANGEIEDLTDRLQARSVDGKTGYQATYTVAQPGSYVFHLEPAPYWEPAEEIMIVHYTKVVVDAYGAGDGWDVLVGFPVEIEPLVRPFGLWTGNAFTGIVRKDGEPVSFAEVEVEWRNDGSVEAPADPFVTQIVRTDSNGVFTYVMPRAGWWGFAALLTGDETMANPDGDEVEVETGALLWVKTVDME